VFIRLTKVPRASPSHDHGASPANREGLAALAALLGLLVEKV
jgi:hypothetical protein